MSVVRYTGQPLPPGTIVCRESNMTVGFCSRPVEVVCESEKTVTLRDLRDRDDIVRRGKQWIAFICDTEAEGWVMHEASMAFVKSEQDIARRQARERADRKLDAVVAAVMLAQGGQS